MRSWVQRNQVQMRWLKFNGRLRNAFGIDGEDWARMYNAQGGRCACCERAIGFDHNTHVDHCHKTGRVRALLCHGCNTSIGHLGEDLETLRRMASYLEKFCASPNSP